MRLLIIGCNGFIGRVIANRASSNGDSVFGLSRSAAPPDTLQGQYLVGDRREPETIRQLVIDNDVDTVVDVLAYTLGETRALTDLLDGVVSRYVMLSSADVYRNYELLHRAASGKPELSAAGEDSPLRTTRYPYRSEPRRSAGEPDAWLDDYDKIPIEEHVCRMRSDWTILRLPMVYGPGDRQRRFQWAARHLATSEAPLEIPIQWARWVTTYGYIDDVAAAVVLASGHIAARNRVFNLGEPNPVDHLTWANRIADLTGWSGGVTLNDDASHEMAKNLGSLDLSVPLQIDTRRIRSELGFRESVALETGLLRTIEDENARGYGSQQG